MRVLGNYHFCGIVRIRRNFRRNQRAFEFNRQDCAWDCGCVPRLGLRYGQRQSMAHYLLRRACGVYRGLYFRLSSLSYPRKDKKSDRFGRFFLYKIKKIEYNKTVC